MTSRRSTLSSPIDPSTRDTARLIARLTAHLDGVTRSRGPLGAPQVLVRAPGLELTYGDQSLPFHAASVGKVATAVLVMQLAREGAFALSDSIATLLPAGTTDGLFVVAGTDHARDVTVLQLLDHTSGVADYFEGRVTSGRRFLDRVLGEPDRTWTPADLIAFSRDNQRAIAAPGRRFAYSDTGYILLGLVVEHVTGRAFHELLHERIFEPLDMRDSYLLFHSTPSNGLRPIAPFRLGRVEASTFASISCDWSGGGIVTTLDDLVTFSRALHRGELTDADQLAEMQRVRNRFRPGIHYGAGMMELRFGEFSPFLRRLPRLSGHIGVLGTHMFYDRDNDAHIAMNFGSTREMVRSFRTLIEIERAIAR